jgi:hypothetical protein
MSSEFQNTDVIPAQNQVQGRLSQAKNDKPLKTHIIMYRFWF